MGKRKNTSGVNDALQGSRKVTAEEVAAFDLSPHLIRLMWDEPFFANVLRTIQKTKTTMIPTAGVTAKGGEVKFFWNPEFLASLSADEVKGLLKHECYHLIFDHTTSRARDPHIIWNYATDLAINSLISENELPKGGLIPGKPFSKLTSEQEQRMGPQAAERYKMISKKIASFPREKHSEWYFEKLMEDDAVKEAIESSKAMGNKSLVDALADGDVKIDENGNLVDKEGNPVTVVPGSGGEGSPMDCHDGWGELSEEQKELVKGQIKQALEDSIKKCDGSNSWGSIPSSMRATLRKMVSKEIPWQSVLKQFCGLSRRADRTSNVRRLNRKYPGIHPGVHRNYKANIAVYVDQSGSVSDRDLELLSGELDCLATHVTFTVFNFDTEVDEKSEREIKKGRKSMLDRTRCGGTDFRCVQKHANKNKKRFDGYLVLTDGYAPDPRGFNKLKRGWVITPGGQLQFNKSNRDFLIAMKDKNDS